MNNSPLVLLFPTHYLGNFVLGLPWVNAVLRDNSKAVVVIDARFEALCRAVLPAETELVLYPRQQLASSQPFFSRLRCYWQFLRALRSYRAGTLVDLEGERFTGVLSRLSACRRRIGPTGKRAQHFYTEVLDLDYYKHRYNAFGTVLAAVLGEQVAPDSHLDYRFAAQLLQSIESRVQSARGRRLVAIHPGASVAYKLWPRAAFVELLRSLEQRGWQVLWVGAGVTDREIIADVMQQLPGSSAINCCDQLGFLELAALFKRCDCFIGSDSGPMHLAASTGIPVLALFGPSIEAIWSPLGNNCQVLRGSDACGENCDAWHCDYAYRCMTSLKPEQVLAAIAGVPDNNQMSPQKGPHG